MLEYPCISYAARYGVGTISRKSAQAEILRDYTRRILKELCREVGLCPTGATPYREKRVRERQTYGFSLTR